MFFFGGARRKWIYVNFLRGNVTDDGFLSVGWIESTWWWYLLWIYVYGELFIILINLYSKFIHNTKLEWSLCDLTTLEK